MASISTSRTRSKMGLILMAYVAFISLGLPDGLLGVAWPSIRAEFNLPLDALGILLFASMVGYLTSSFFSGKIMSALGVGGLLAASCLLTGAGLIGYTLAPGWWIIIALGVVAGLGAGAIDAGINTYIAANFGESLMQWLHASFGIGITLGPLIMSSGINWFGNWRLGYIFVGVLQLALAACFALTLSMWKETGPAAAEAAPRLTDYKTPLSETFRQPRVWLSVLLFFIYAGVEMTLGHWGYTLLTEGRGITPQIAGLFAGSYWAMFTVGRFLAGWYTRRISGTRLLRISILSALVGALLVLINQGEIVTLIGIAIIGFSIAPIFPGLVSGTQERVGARHAANTIGIQISISGLGIAALPGLAGVVAQRTSIEMIPVFVVSCVVLLFIGFSVAMKLKPQS